MNYQKQNSQKYNKKGFTLIELVIVMAIIAILVLLAVPKFMNYISLANKTKIISNIKTLEDASELYYIENQKWPRDNINVYTASEISTMAVEIIDKTGDSIVLDPDGKYYLINYNSLNNYVSKPDDYEKYILQNPVGNIYYLSNKITSKPESQIYSINITNGTSSMNTASTGDSVTITANMLEGMNTVKWTISPDVTITSGNLYSNTFTFIMPNSDVTITGIYNNYVLATDANFTKITDSLAPNDYYYQYTGSAEYVEVPTVINGDTITDTYHMFSNTSVKGVKINNPNITNMSQMFYYSKATSLDLIMDTSNVTNMSLMFYSSKATRIDLSNFDTSKVYFMNEMFFDSCATSLDLSKFNTSKVIMMKGMFNSSRASTLDLSSFDTSNVTYMNEMFNNSYATTLNLTSFNTSKVIYMNNMFYNSKATNLDINNFDTSNVIDMRYMFGNSAITSLDLSSFDTSKVTNMGYMFVNSVATTGYARTQTDADKFNASSSKPETLSFTVKP